MDTVNDWPGIHLPANECDGITRRSCNDGVCAGCRVFYVYNVDAAAARMTSCRAHRKLYAQDILVDLMALQIKFSVIKSSQPSRPTHPVDENITHELSNINVYAVAI